MIEKMNERITIQQNTVIIDKYGNHKNGWTEYFSCAAYASTYQYDREKESVIWTTIIKQDTHESKK